MTSRKIAVANGNLVGYPDAGGHLSVYLQYLLGLRALGHEVLWLEFYQRSSSAARDHQLITKFFRQLREYGVADGVVVCFTDEGSAEPPLAKVAHISNDGQSLMRALQGVELLWNMTGDLPRHHLKEFPRTAFIDLDPGHLQVSALTWDLGLDEHDVRLTIGRRIGAGEACTPDLGLEWHEFSPIVHLPMWASREDPGPQAPFTSVTQWWAEGELWFGGRVMSIKKRDAYLRYVGLPRLAHRTFRLAANIDPDDVAGDRDRMSTGGWQIVDPHAVARNPALYREFIASSRAEISCPKPVFRELDTGWISDRSVAYLASGRPVVAEDTGFSKDMPTGEGLLPFTTQDEAVAAIRSIDRDYARHSLAARRLAEEFFDARLVLPRMLDASLA